MEVSELLIKHGIKNKIVKAPVSIVNSCRFAIVINKKDVMLCKRVIGENITSII